MQLTNEELVAAIRRAWDEKIATLREDVDGFLGEAVEPKIGTETKVKHRESQLLYTVHSIGPDEVVLRTPTGRLFTIDSATFDDEYEVD